MRIRCAARGLTPGITPATRRVSPFTGRVVGDGRVVSDGRVVGDGRAVRDELAPSARRTSTTSRPAGEATGVATGTRAGALRVAGPWAARALVSAAPRDDVVTGSRSGRLGSPVPGSASLACPWPGCGCLACGAPAARSLACSATSAARPFAWAASATARRRASVTCSRPEGVRTRAPPRSRGSATATMTTAAATTQMSMPMMVAFTPLRCPNPGQGHKPTTRHRSQWVGWHLVRPPQPMSGRQASAVSLRRWLITVLTPSSRIVTP